MKNSEVSRLRFTEGVYLFQTGFWAIMIPGYGAKVDFVAVFSFAQWI